MQVTETLNQGLKREFRVVVPAADLNGKLAAKLDELRGRANLPGFRPGKVPVAHLKRLYGKSVMAEILNDTVTESTRSLAVERKLKLANEPKVSFTEDQQEIEAVIEGKGDFAYTMALEVLPGIELKDFKAVKLQRQVAEVTDADVEAALGRIADQNRPYAAKPEGAAAETGDKLTIDFRGAIDGEVFEGGSAEGATLVIGSGMFIPGFEDQLVGAKAGEAREVKVTFPEGYAAQALAGKDAVFAVTVREIAAAGEVAVDDAFAKTLGMESLDKLKAAIRDQIGREDAAQSRRRIKRKLLDALDAEYRFELPETLVEQEFEVIWRNMTAEMQRANRSFEDEGTTEDAARADYRAIAERRVRLGLLLAEIGERNQIKVSDEEVQRGMVERVRQFPADQQRKAFEFLSKTPQALAEIRAPIFEEKVVDFVLELAEVDEVKVAREDLFKDDEEAAPAKGEGAKAD
jgi:trigger factor